jgi:hypothetical protein
MKKFSYFNTYLVVAIFASLALGAVAADPKLISDSQTYTLTTCPVTGQTLGAMGEPVVETINGREVRFCCAGCVGKYRDNADEYGKKVDAAIIEQQKDAYPLDKCVVLGGPLGGMGEPVDYVYQNRLMRFCCAGCIQKFESDPAAYLAKLDAAVIEKERASYPLDKCVVDGEPLGDTPVELVIGNRLVLLHSKACADAVRKNPATYISKIDAAAKADSGTK